MEAISSIQNSQKAEVLVSSRPDGKTSLEAARDIARKLLAYCRANDWKGYDPYDALNSRILKFIPFSRSRIIRLGLTQVLKRSPLNFRPLLLVPKTQNPKAMALFLMAFVKLSKLGLLDQEEDLIEKMTGKLVTLRSPNTPYWCWGYSFPWQTRTIIVSRGAPNLVCTTFVANALLEAYERNPEQRYLEMVFSAADYILNELYWAEGDAACFSYPLPSLRSRVHNANFLGAALLCRIYNHCGEKKYLEAALKVARYSSAKQHEDGSWDYGESSKQRWADNFHTGYNLCALRSICQCAGTSEFESHIRRGFEFYRVRFFRKDGEAKYFQDRTYPIDIHSVAQSIITLLALKDLDENNVSLAHAVFQWAMTNMWDEQGYFYYRAFPFFTNKIPYMRWSQAWMFLALSMLLEEGRGDRRTYKDGSPGKSKGSVKLKK